MLIDRTTLLPDYIQKKATARRTRGQRGGISGELRYETHRKLRTWLVGWMAGNNRQRASTKGSQAKQMTRCCGAGTAFASFVLSIHPSTSMTHPAPRSNRSRRSASASAAPVGAPHAIFEI